MQTQIFVEPVAQHEALTATMNAWLADHPGIAIEDRAVQIFHNHLTNADDLLVLLFYQEKAPRRAPSRKVEG